MPREGPCGPKGVTADRLRTTALEGWDFFLLIKRNQKSELSFTLIRAFVISAKGKIEDIKNKSSSAGEQNE